MARSLYRPDPSHMVENFAGKEAVFHKASGMYYTVVQKPDGYYQQRYRLGLDGKQTGQMEERIDYVIGSGDQARSYLHRSLEGKLIQLPVSWYPENGGSWAMTPGYDGADQKDFHGVISTECIFCHDAYPKSQPAAVQQSAMPLFTSELPQGIDCQRCHGPGGAHVRAAEAARPKEQLIRSTIVNPAHLGRERQMEVCMECHLSTSASQSENISLRAGRDVFSYRPGMALADYKLYFDVAAPADPARFAIPDAAYRLRLSKCFRDSQMTCLTCHDPHQQLQGKQAQDHFLQVCASCHQNVKHTVALPAQETCLSCHMPQRRGEYAVHTVLTDHYIQRQRPLRDLLQPMTPEPPPPAPNARLALYYPASTPPGPSGELDLAAARASSGTDREDLSAFEATVRRYQPAQATYYLTLGRAYARSGDLPHAREWLEQAFVRAPHNHELAGELVETLLAKGDSDRARIILEGLASEPPADAHLLANLGNIYARAGEVQRAETVLKKALSIDPELGQAYSLLGQLKQQSGDLAGAEENFRAALRLRPDLAEAHTNLANLLVASDRYREAEFEYKQAFLGAPKSAGVHHGYGLLLILNKAYPQAEAELRQAIALEPTEAKSHADLADLMAQRGGMAGAAAEYRAALLQNPALAEANLGMGLLLLQKGEREAARGFCAKAAADSDPAIQAEAQRCLAH